MKNTLVAGVVILTACLSSFISIAQAAPCLMITLTGTQGGPPAFKGLAGPGTLVRYGDDSNNCSALKLQFDAGRGTVMRLAELNIPPEQLNAVFFTHMHNDHTEGFADLITLRWMSSLILLFSPAKLPNAIPRSRNEPPGGLRTWSTRLRLRQKKSHKLFGLRATLK